MKYFKLGAGLLVLLLIFSGAFFTPKPYTETEFSMDTVMTVTAYGKNAKSAVRQVFDRIRELDEKLDPRNPESQVARINHATGGTPVSVDEDVFYIIESARHFSETSDGAFDITLYPVSTLWGFGTESAALPKEEALKATLAETGSHKLSLDGAKKTVTKQSGSLKIDLGGVAKGYAADEAIRILKEAGIQSAYVDLGGNIGILGEKPLTLKEILRSGKRTRPYSIGIQKPGAPRGELIETVSLSEGFVVTSGDYERFFEENGKQYHHILDPKTGFPAETGLKSVTVIARSGILADMLSTAIFVQGAEQADRYLDLTKSILLVDSQLKTTYIE